jgi:hypothetical protein
LIISWHQGVQMTIFLIFFLYNRLFQKIKCIETRNGEWWHGPVCGPGQQTHGLHDVRPRARATEGT